MKCQAGQFGSNCSKCAKGRYRGSDDDAVKCFHCAEGQYQAAEGQAVCLPCVPGKYNDQQQQTQCKDCPINKFSNDTELKACYDCPHGRIATNGSAGCSMCPAGKFVFKNDESCLECPDGYFQTSREASSCHTCPRGRSAKNGSAECSLCPAGSYILEDDNSCLECPEGYFQTKQEISSCELCRRGETSTKGSGNCQRCDLGKYESNKKCLGCPAGQYQDARGEPECKKCDKDTYNEEVNATSKAQCKACHKNRTTGNGSGITDSSSCICRKETFYSAWDGNCTECPVGANCSKRHGMMINEVYPKSGYWRESLMSDVFIECSKAILSSDKAKRRCCPSAQCNNLTLNSTEFHPDTQCAKGHKGALCGTCDLSYVMRDGTCEPCNGGAKPKLGVAGLGVVCLILFFAAWFLVAKTETYIVRREESRHKDDFTNLTTLFIGYAQIMSSITETCSSSTEWGASFTLFSKSFSIVNFDVAFMFRELSCSLNFDFFTRLILHFLTPLIIVAAVIPATYLAIHRTSRRREVNNNKKEAQRAYGYKLTMMLLLLIYPVSALGVIRNIHIHVYLPIAKCQMLATHHIICFYTSLAI